MDDTKQKLREFGAYESEIKAIEELVATSSVFCFSKPHADRFSTIVEQGTANEIVECLRAILDGLRGWVGDTAKYNKYEARRWIKRVKN